MKYDIGEYNVVLDIPTDNFIFNLFTSYHTQYMWDYIPIIEQQIKNKKELIILFGAFENLHEYDHWVHPINDLKEKFNNPIVVLNGRLTSDDRLTINTNFNYHKILFFDHVSNVNCYEELRSIDEIQNWLRNYKFYWASAKDLYPRRFLLANLIENNLINDNLVNYKGIISNIPSDYLKERVSEYYCTLIENKCDTIRDMIPLPYLDETIEFNLTSKKFYNGAYVGIITDTFYADHGGPTGIFFSEKVFQAINHHQLFFYIGPPHSMKYMKNLGYHVYDDVFDLTYDSIEDHGERLIKAVESLIKFLKQPLDIIHKIYQDNAVKVYENKILLQSQNKNKIINDILQKALNEN